jgi:hypothetical protein
MDEHQAVMLPTGLGVLPSYGFEVDPVVGEHDPSLLLGYFEEVGIGQAAQARIVRGGDHVVAALAKTRRDLPADLLVEK